MLTSPSDERFASLRFPLRHAGALCPGRPEVALAAGVLAAGAHANHSAVAHPSSDRVLLQIGSLQAMAARSTPVITREEGAGSSTLVLQFGGDRCRYRDGLCRQEMQPGDVHLNPRCGGRVDVGYFSGFLCAIQHQRLRRTMAAMHGGAVALDLEPSRMFKAGSAGGGSIAPASLWAFFTYLDRLLAESHDLAAGLGLDDQLYRLLAFALLQAQGGLERIERRWSLAPQRWAPALDELVDYITANAHRNLSLTDLEEQSHYSARHLQTLFRERFACTPMQFVRRQRLQLAMQTLRSAARDDTVTRIARACGYRHTASFSTDFQRHFGVKPSVVLRAADVMR